MNYQVNVVLNKDENGYYAYCPALPGCHSQGDTFEEAMVNIREAIELYLETLSEEEIQASLTKETVTATVEVSIS